MSVLVYGRKYIETSDLWAYVIIRQDEKFRIKRNQLGRRDRDASWGEWGSPGNKMEVISNYGPDITDGAIFIRGEGREADKAVMTLKDARHKAAFEAAVLEFNKANSNNKGLSMEDVFWDDHDFGPINWGAVRGDYQETDDHEDDDDYDAWDDDDDTSSESSEEDT
jgi:hypothetical protein